MKRVAIALSVAILMIQFSCARPRCTSDQWDRFCNLYYADKVLKGGHVNPLKRCPIHEVGLIEMDVYLENGMYYVPPRSFILAKLRHFPQSYLVIPTGTCDSVFLGTCIKYQCCSICRGDEIEWRKKHGWDIPDFPELKKEEERIRKKL